MLSRRQMLVSAGLAGGAALSLSSTKVMATLETPKLPVQGKPIGDFLILPDSAPMPLGLTPPNRLPPELCRVGDAPARQTALSETAISPEDLAERSRLPLYAPDLLWNGGLAVFYPDGGVFVATMTFESPDAVTGQVEPNVTVTALREFSRPVPLWEANPVEPNGPAVRLEEAAFLPSPGVMVRSAVGFVFHWVASDTYYTMTVDNHSSLREARRLVASLTRIEPFNPLTRAQ